jgi:hypothetical protein
VTGAGAAVAAGGWLAAAADPGAAVGTDVAVELPHAVASSTLAIANPMNLFRIDELLHL